MVGICVLADQDKEYPCKNELFTIPEKLLPTMSSKPLPPP